jgi:phosphoglucosamine mutase
MSLRFGTDGVRGPADEFTDELVTALGEAATRVLDGSSGFLIACDTRESGPRLERALAVGIARGGGVPESLGVVPTPTAAWASVHRDVPAAVISASHNVWSDNGIKFFAAGGRKLPDAVEARLEATLDEILATSPTGGSTFSDAVDDGSSLPRDGALGPWSAALAASIGDRRLDGLRVVIDCANGASSDVAPSLLRALGAEVDVLHASPNGRNINDACGSTHPGDLQQRVIKTGADIGLAFDGDADRLLAVDEQGLLVDGDHLLAMFAADLRRRGRLAGDLVVVTVMTNLGFRMAMSERGITVVETPVGDRHVLEALARTGGSLGGEQSGHIVFAEMATTGDGLLSGIQLLDLVHRSARPFSELAAESMTQLPQVLMNVPVASRRSDFSTHFTSVMTTVLADDVSAEEQLLGERGRILIRPSGTEPLVRVMVEAETSELADGVARRLAAKVEEAFPA